MPVETRAQLAARYFKAVVEASPLNPGLLEVEVRELGVDGEGAEGILVQRGGWWEEDSGKMASGLGPEGRQRVLEKERGRIDL